MVAALAYFEVVSDSEPQWAADDFAQVFLRKTAYADVRNHSETNHRPFEVGYSLPKKGVVQFLVCNRRAVLPDAIHGCINFDKKLHLLSDGLSMNLELFKPFAFAVVAPSRPTPPPPALHSSPPHIP